MFLSKYIKSKNLKKENRNLNIAREIYSSLLSRYYNINNEYLKHNKQQFEINDMYIWSAKNKL